jgi:phosphoglycerate kinase
MVEMLFKKPAPFRTVREIPVLNNIPVFVRAALNVPVKNNEVANTYRLRRALPTIEYLREKRAKVILIGHIGEKGTETLEPVARALQKFIPNLTFCPVSIGAQAREAIRAMHPGDVLMLENLRRNKGEIANDATFARELAALADVFVEDAFDVCHREHASVVTLPTMLPAYAGLLVEEEVRELSKALKPGHPALAIIGGAKFATKEPVVTTLLEHYDKVFVGGALANDFMKAKGLPVEVSLVSDANTDAIDELLKNPKLMLPLDEVIGAPGSSESQSHVGMLDGKAPFEAVLDDGPRTLAHLSTLIRRAKTVLWNGPLGNYENGFIKSTQVLVQEIARSKAHSIVGGGDTVAAIEELGLSHGFSFISTGGGAMLDFLAKGTLPGLAVLRQPQKGR